MSSVRVRVDDVVRQFQSPAETVRAVDEVSFTARTGEFVTLHGASGSGKSTLLAVLAGLQVPDAGTVVIDDVDVSSASADARARLRLSSIGVVFQHDNLIEEFTAAENVGFPLELQGIEPAQVTAEVQSWLGRVGMGDHAHRYPAQLSGGQQQRVGIARALVGRRRVLIADEPTGALDSVNSRALYELIRSLCDTEGITAIVSSHDPVIREYASRVLTMTDGRLA